MNPPGEAPKMNRKYEQMITVDLGGGAGALIPRGSLDYRLRYGRNPDVVSAGVVESFRYLIMNCTQKEQVRRLALMKKALKEFPDED
jgi:hypothetical protein